MFSKAFFLKAIESRDCVLESIKSTKIELEQTFRLKVHVVVTDYSMWQWVDAIFRALHNLFIDEILKSILIFFCVVTLSFTT